jgi:RNA polymerase sigma-B factor
VEDRGAGTQDPRPVLCAEAMGGPGEVDLARCRTNRSVSTSLRLRLAAARRVNRALVEELRKQRLEVRHQRDRLQATVQEVLQWRTAARPAPEGCRHRGPGLAALPDTEWLLRVHDQYVTTRRPSLRAELLAAYDGFALGLARRFPSRREAPEDLAQVARIGLLKALDRFDPAWGRPFTAFARATIVGELKRHVRDCTWSMRVPRSLQEQYLVVVRALDDLTQELGRSPRIPDVAARAGLTDEQVLEAMELGGAQRPLSLDIPVGEGDGRLLDPGGEDGAYGAVEGRVLIGTLFARLSERERQVLQMRFGDELTQAEIAKHIGVSQMYVSRLLGRTLARLRAWAN